MGPLVWHTVTGDNPLLGEENVGTPQTIGSPDTARLLSLLIHRAFLLSSDRYALHFLVYGIRIRPPLIVRGKYVCTLEARRTSLNHSNPWKRCRASLHARR